MLTSLTGADGPCSPRHFAYNAGVKRPLTFASEQAGLQRLLRVADHLQQWERLLGKLLPKGLAGCCHVAAVEQRTLVIAAEHGTAAARLRQYQPALLRLIQQQGQGNGVAGGEISAIRVVVQTRAQVVPSRRPKPGLSGKALQAVEAQVAQLPAGSLQQAMSRLLQHHRKG